MREIVWEFLAIEEVEILRAMVFCNLQEMSCRIRLRQTIWVPRVMTSWQPCSITPPIRRRLKELQITTRQRAREDLTLAKGHQINDLCQTKMSIIRSTPKWRTQIYKLCTSNSGRENTMWGPFKRALRPKTQQILRQVAWAKYWTQTRIRRQMWAI